jgi:hypothetical protein
VPVGHLDHARDQVPLARGEDAFERRVGERTLDLVAGDVHASDSDPRSYVDPGGDARSGANGQQEQDVNVSMQSWVSQ